MRLIVAKDYADVSRKAANIIAAQIHLKPDCVLGLATGSSPVGTYKELIAKYESGELDFSQVRTINLDEYVGLSGEHDQSYRYFMNYNLFDKVNINKENTFVPDGTCADPAAFCKAYDDDTEDPNKWVRQFDEFPLDIIAPAIFELLTKGLISSKNLKSLQRVTPTKA